MAPKWASFLGLWTIFWAAMSVGTSRLLHTSWWSAWLSAEIGFLLVWSVPRRYGLIPQKRPCHDSSHNALIK